MPRIRNKCPPPKKTLSHKFCTKINFWGEVFVYSVVLKKLGQKKTSNKFSAPFMQKPRSSRFSSLIFFSDLAMGAWNGWWDSLDSGDTIHLTNQNQTTTLFEVRTKSIHQNKKDTTKQTGNNKKHFQKRKTKNTPIEKQHSFLRVKTCQNTYITSLGNPSLHVSSVKTWGLPFPPDTLLGRQGGDLEVYKEMGSNHITKPYWNQPKKKRTLNSGGVKTFIVDLSSWLGRVGKIWVEPLSSKVFIARKLLGALFEPFWFLCPCCPLGIHPEMLTWKKKMRNIAKGIIQRVVPPISVALLLLGPFKVLNRKI